MNAIFSSLLLLFILSSQPLAAPTDLMVDIDGDLAHLSWTDTNEFEEGYLLYRDNIRHVRLPANTTTYIDDVSDNKRHTYMVSAFAGDEESGFSNEVNTRSEGIPDRVLYIVLPLLLLVLVAVLYLGRHSKKLDGEEEEVEIDVPVLLSDRLRKF